MNRRAFLSISRAPLRRDHRKPTATVTILLGEEIGRISPLVYGNFIEHIESVIDGGIWVEPDSKIPNRNGHRLDTIRAMERVHPPVFRWPGGCYADTYNFSLFAGDADDAILLNIGAAAKGGQCEECSF